MESMLQGPSNGMGCLKHSFQQPLSTKKENNLVAQGPESWLCIECQTLNCKPPSVSIYEHTSGTTVISGSFYGFESFRRLPRLLENQLLEQNNLSYLQRTWLPSLKLTHVCLSQSIIFGSVNVDFTGSPPTPPKSLLLLQKLLVFHF